MFSFVKLPSPAPSLRPSLPAVSLACALALGTTFGHAGELLGANTAASPGVTCAALAIPLTLRAAVDLALCTQAGVVAGQAGLAQARAAVEGQRATLFPQVGLSGTWGTTESSVGTASRTTGGLTLTLSQVLYDFGARQAGVKSSQALVAAAAQDLQGTRQAVVLEAARRYFAVGNASMRVDSAEARQRSAERARQQAVARLDAGVGVRLEVLQAQAERAQAQLELTRARSEVRLAQSLLSQYLGLAEGEVHLPSPDALRAQPGQLPALLPSLLEQALQANPALQAARARALAARHSTDAAQAATKPVFRLSASTAWEQSRDTSTRNDSRVLLSVDIPLLDGGANRARMDQAVAAQERAQALAIQAEQDAAESVRRAHLQLVQADEALHAADLFVSAAQAALEQAQGQYAAGVLGLSEVLQAQVAATSARESLVQAQAAWREAQLSLAAAVGSLDPSAL